MAVEVARGKRYFPGWNVARWWLSHEAHQRDPQRFLANFEAGLGIFARHDILVMPVLFNRWRDPVCDFGGVPLDHLIPTTARGPTATTCSPNPTPGTGSRRRCRGSSTATSPTWWARTSTTSASTRGTCATSP
jgi:hypothetical protein